ncbi:MAG TPA: CPBP family intramembrane glutamic endopeptidase [Rhizomicrobium sp.]|jgi:membrane protease YdiL (CAAX protease family)
MTTTRITQIVIGLVLALGLPFCHLGDLGRNLFGPLWGGEVLWWALFAAVIAYVAFVEHKALSSIGYRAPGTMDIVLGVIAGIVAVMGIGFAFQVVLPAMHLGVNRQLGALIATPLLFRVATVTRAAVVEETLFRGYGFERLAELTKSPLAAALLTWVLFSMAHLQSWGWGQVIIAAWGGLVLTVLYLWRRNLWANIICHWLTDGTGFILMPLLMAHHS